MSKERNLPAQQGKTTKLPMIADQDRETYLRLQGFAKRMNHQPRKERIKQNRFAKNADYLPIGIIEMQLDEDFFGLWQTHSFTTKVIANEIVGEIVLEIFHPVAQTWIRRTGAAGTQIKMRNEENGGDGNITNVQNKIINTLTADYPHLKSECIKNAAKSLGKKYGRDLNRKDFQEYTPQMNDINEIHNDLKS